MKEKFWLYWTIVMWLCPLAYIRDYYLVGLDSRWLEGEHLWIAAFMVMALVKHRLTGCRPWEL